MDQSRIDELLEHQEGVVSRAQVRAAGGRDHDIARLVRRREWALLHPGVYVDHTGPPSWQQQAWGGVLATWPSALCDVSALQADDIRRRDGAALHVAVDRQRKLVAPAGVVLHRVVRLEEKVRWNLGPPRLLVEEALIDVAARATDPLESVAVLAGACQSRHTTPARLQATLAGRPRVPGRSWLSAVLRDLEDGTCSTLEHGYLVHVERPHGLPRAERQRRERGRSGVVYRDASYGRLLVELDGFRFHGSTRQRDQDLERDLDAALDGRITVRLSWGQVFNRGCSTAGKLAELLRQRGWPGPARACGTGCSVRG